MKHIRLLQALLLVAVLAVVAVVGWHLLHFQPAPKRRSSGSSAGRTPAPDSARPFPAPSPPVTRGLSLRSVRTVGASREFVVDAPLFEEREDEQILSGGVRAQGEGKDGFSYAIAADSVRGDREWQKATLTGNVRIRRSDGLTLESEVAEHYEREQSDVARGHVRIVGEGRVVLCDRAEYKSRSREVFLDGHVIVFEAAHEGGSARAFTAEHLYHSRETEQVVLREGVRAIGAGLAILADRMDLALVKGKPRTATFRAFPERQILLESWDPDACGGGAGEAPLRLLRMRSIEIGFDERGEAEHVGRVERYDPLLAEGYDGALRIWSLVAGEFEAGLARGGRLRDVQLRESVEWQEEPGASGTASSLSAPQASAEFSRAGALAAALFPDGVELRRGSGERLTGKLGRFRDGVFSVTGSPRLESGTSVVEAERFDIVTRTGTLTAESGVRSEFRIESRPGVPPEPDAGSREPFRVRSDRIELGEGGRVAVYRGHARAWQGASVLEAEAIRVDTSFGGLEAEGRAHALLARPDGGRNTASADRLVWRDDRIELFGHAVADGDDLKLQADHIVVLLEADGRTARVLEGEGGVVAEREGTRATAERLVHQVEKSETTLLSGARMVHVTGRDGSETWGDRMVLLRRGDRVVVGSGQDGVARTRLGDSTGTAR